MSMQDWRATLLEPAVAGVHLAEAPEFAAIVETATDLGFQIARIDFAGCAAKSEAMARIAAALDLPEWFGANWDALADALEDFGDASSPGVLLVLAALEDWATAAPHEVDMLLEILDEAALRHAAEGVPFWALLGDPSSTAPGGFPG